MIIGGFYTIPQSTMKDFLRDQHSGRPFLLSDLGTDKILQPIGGEGSRRDKTTITNDGATILKSVWLDNPAAKILVDVSKQQDSQCGDGTTGVVVLAAELLRNAEQLIEQKIHPQVIKIEDYILSCYI